MTNVPRISRRDSHRIRCRRFHRLSGFTLIELIASCAMLAVALSLALPVMVSAAHARRVTEQRQIALQHASNLMEFETAKSWTELQSGEYDINNIPDDVARMLPGLQIHIKVTESTDGIRAKRVGISMQWMDRAGKRMAPKSLFAWVHPVREVQK